MASKKTLVLKTLLFLKSIKGKCPDFFFKILPRVRKAYCGGNIDQTSILVLHIIFV